MKKCRKHKKEFFYDNATAIYSKRGGVDDAVSFAGRAEGCGTCGEMWFVCDDKRLRIVEVEL